MIKPNELRIGNLILYKEFGEGDGVVGRIKAGDFGRLKFHDDEYFPIPLTPEWLERFALVKNGNQWDGPEMHTDTSTSYFIIQEGKKPGTFELFGSEWTLGKPFQYVHQLQNLYFALTDEELTIKETV